VHWSFRSPTLTAAKHILTLRSFIEKNQIDVLGIDPAYLAMGLQGNEAANQFAVGAVLMNLSTLQADTGVTPILASHFRMHMPIGTMPSLEHVAGAGFGQWARQWVLLNRREEFNDENPGSHRMLMSFGGSAGHAGAVALDNQRGESVARTIRGRDSRPERRRNGGLDSTSDITAEPRALRQPGHSARSRRGLQPDATGRLVHAEGTGVDSCDDAGGSDEIENLRNSAAIPTHELHVRELLKLETDDGRPAAGAVEPMDCRARQRTARDSTEAGQLGD
jgi:hypothetical protein